MVIGKNWSITYSDARVFCATAGLQSSFPTARRTFKGGLEKWRRSLETGRSEPGLSLGGDPEPSGWSVGAEVYGDFDNLPHNAICGKPSMPNGERILFIRHALRTGSTLPKCANYCIL